MERIKFNAGDMYTINNMSDVMYTAPNIAGDFVLHNFVYRPADHIAARIRVPEEFMEVSEDVITCPHNFLSIHEFSKYAPNSEEVKSFHIVENIISALGALRRLEING